MEFGIQKCACIILKRGKTISFDGIKAGKFPHWNREREIQGSGRVRCWICLAGGNESKTDNGILPQDTIDSEVEVERSQCFGSY